MLLFQTFYSSNNPEKYESVSSKILSSTTVFNTDNDKKYFSSSKSAY